MTPVGAAQRRRSGGSTALSARVDGLAEAAEAARGRLDDAVVDDAAQAAERARARLGLSAEHTVVALAGATGSGKSSLFNRLSGVDLAEVGLRRPTTAWALACSWGPTGAEELLAWLGIPERHQLDRLEQAGANAAEPDLEGLILLDLPDHDSTEVAHHLEVRRLVALTDVMIWVLDPQKYADAAIHHQFLRPLSSHAAVMMVVLNHVDEVPDGCVEETLDDVRRLLVADGLSGVPVIATSATRGDGMNQLRAAITARVEQKKDAGRRVLADVASAAARLAAATGTAAPADVRATARKELVDACADAAGVPVVVEATQRATLVRGRQATGWPVTKWLSRFRPDPLRRLHLAGGGKQARQLASSLSLPRSSVPEPTRVQRARVAAAVRSLADGVTAEMAAPWALSVRAAAIARLDDFADALDVSVTGTDLGLARDPWWWRVARGLQWLLFVVAVVGALWLGALAGLSYLQLPEPSDLSWHRLPLPTLLLLGGGVGGVVLAAFCRVLTRVSARGRSRRAEARLRHGIEVTVDDLVLTPMAAEIEAYVQCRDGVQVALG